MAGKPKKRIDYAGWSVDIFSTDSKIDKLLDAQGWVGFGIYFYLCQMAYGSEGYFYEWCYDLCASTARKMGGGVGAGTVKETVDYCLQIGLFDKGLFDRWGVLTSRGIQKNYLIVLKSKNRIGTTIIKDYWLLDDEDENYQGVVFVAKNGERLGRNTHLLGENDYLLGENGHSLRQKESKVNKSKVKEINACDFSYQDFSSVYPKQGNNFLAETQFCRLLVNDCHLTAEELIEAAKNYAEACKILGTEDRFIKAPQNFLSDNYFVSYLPGNYKAPKKPTKKNKPKIEQHDYDFEELERALMSN